MSFVNISVQDSGDFSSYQMQKLMKSSKLTQRLDDVRKEINMRAVGVSTLALGVDSLTPLEKTSTGSGQVEAKRVISEEGTHYVLIKKAASLQRKPRAHLLRTDSLNSNKSNPKTPNKPDIENKASILDVSKASEASTVASSFDAEEDVFERCRRLAKVRRQQVLNDAIEAARLKHDEKIRNEEEVDDVTMDANLDDVTKQNQLTECLGVEEVGSPEVKTVQHSRSNNLQKVFDDCTDKLTSSPPVVVDVSSEDETNDLNRVTSASVKDARQYSHLHRNQFSTSLSDCNQSSTSHLDRNQSSTSLNSTKSSIEPVSQATMLPCVLRPKDVLLQDDQDARVASSLVSSELPVVDDVSSSSTGAYTKLLICHSSVVLGLVCCECVGFRRRRFKLHRSFVQCD